MSPALTREEKLRGILDWRARCLGDACVSVPVRFRRVPWWRAQMAYLAAIALGVLFMLLVYTSHWVVQAWVAKMKNDASVPATADVEIKVPKAWERVLEIEAFIYDFRFTLFVIVFLGGLGLAMFLGMAPQ